MSFRNRFVTLTLGPRSAALRADRETFMNPLGMWCRFLPPEVLTCRNDFRLGVLFPATDAIMRLSCPRLCLFPTAIRTPS